ncbi:MAG: hypothetical protein K5872_06770 [Rhizobiaceae bacterium]|nr:hypothetical protein [Rhizobiaceae bacterium]MCV0405915.1 hypothetical protein [Rhizobiaceae bacterium]
MDEIRKVAFNCVARAVGFGSLAIALVMLSLAFQPALALRAGAIMALAMAGILTLKATWVPYQNHRRMEAWLYLDEHSRPAENHAGQIMSNVMGDVYVRFALVAFKVACTLFLASLGVAIIRMLQAGSG